MGVGNSQQVILGLAGLAVLAAVLWLGLFFYGRQKKTREKRKAIKARAERARMSYDDYAKEYAKAFAALEGKGYCVLDVIHDLSDEWQARDGAHQFIAYEEAAYLCEKMRRSKKSPLLLILHTLGGYSFPSEMIANAIKLHPVSKDSYVPYVAMSGGTVIALATDKIHMGKDAFLGPIDTQYKGYPAAAFDQLKRDKDPNAINDEVLLTSYMVEQHKQTARDRAKKILNPKHMQKDDEDHAIRELMEKGRHHAEPISFKEAADVVKLNVDTKMPAEIYALVDARLGMLRNFDRKNGTLPPHAGTMPPPVLAEEKTFANIARIETPDPRFGEDSR